MNAFTNALERATMATIDRVLQHLPQLLGALVLLLLGWLLAKLMRLAANRAVGLVDSLMMRSVAGARWQLGRSARLVGEVMYWVVLLFFVAAATQTLGLQTFTTWLARLLDHLPTVAAGLLIMAAGYLLSGVVSQVVQAAATGLAPTQRAALGRVAQGATLVVALLVGADQVGVKVTWIAIFAALLLASVLGGMALAVSLGARSYVANLIGAHHLRQALQTGQLVRVGAHEGHIVDISATSLVLETPEGRVVLPGRTYHDDVITVLSRAEPPRAEHSKADHA